MILLHFTIRIFRGYSEYLLETPRILQGNLLHVSEQKKQQRDKLNFHEERMEIIIY